MNSSILSTDSLGESQIDLLKNNLNQKDKIISEKSEIIKSLRQQVEDLNQELLELENGQQITQQRVDRLTKDLTERDQELEAVSHALHEVETANENLTDRLNRRTEQVHKYLEDLVAAKKELEETRATNEELMHKNERLTTELAMANSQMRAPQTGNETTQTRHVELPRKDSDTVSLREEITHIAPSGTARKSRLGPQRAISLDLSPMTCPETEQISRPKLDHKNRPEQLAAALHFQMADEVGETMEFQSMPEPTQWTPQTPTQLIKPKEKKIYCENHRPKPQPVKEETFDPIAEYKLRVARANELARRNMQTKPLHQTSYPLELDTFDTTDLTELEIKRGNVHNPTSRPPQRPPPQPPVQQEQKVRKALSNLGNTPPVVRRVYKKAEAFIV